MVDWSPRVILPRVIVMRRRQRQQQRVDGFKRIYYRKATKRRSLNDDDERDEEPCSARNTLCLSPRPRYKRAQFSCGSASGQFGRCLSASNSAALIRRILKLHSCRRHSVCFVAVHNSITYRELFRQAQRHLVPILLSVRAVMRVAKSVQLQS